MDQKLVREFLDYDPETGVLTWRARDRKWFKTDHAWKSWNTRFSGKLAGCPEGGGYIKVAIFNRQYIAHRLAWLWMTGERPAEVDHINHVRDDNRWINLREATRAANGQNLSIRSDNTSGVMGVCWRQAIGKWDAQIKVGGKKHHLGRFSDKSAAIAARRAAEVELGFHPNHGRVAA